MNKRPDPHDLTRAFRKQAKRIRQGKTAGMGAPTARVTQRHTPLREIGLDSRLRAMQTQGFIEKNLRKFVFSADGTILLGRSPRDGWHLSISFPNRYPTWDEIAEARYRLIPDDVDMALILPSQAEYVNFHPNCFHLYEVVRVADLDVPKEEVLRA